MNQPSPYASPYATPEANARARSKYFRRLYGLPPQTADDTRPVIDFGDPESLKRDDLSRDERDAIKNSTFLIRYGAEISFPDLKEMRAAVTTGEAKAMVDKFWAEYACAPLFKEAMETEGPAFVFDSLANLYPTPEDDVPVPIPGTKFDTSLLKEQLAARWSNPPCPLVAQVKNAPAALSPTGRNVERNADFVNLDYYALMDAPVHTVAPPVTTPSLVDTDYSRMEARMMAHLASKGKVLLADGLTVKNLEDVAPEDQILMGKVDMDGGGFMEFSPEECRQAQDRFARGKLAGALEKTTEAFHGVSNAMAQADAAAQMMEAGMSKLNTKLEELVATYGIILDPNTPDQLNISFPEGMALDTQHAIIEELMRTTQEEPPRTEPAPQMTLVLHNQDREMERLHLAMDALHEGPSEVRPRANRGGHGMLLGALQGLFGISMDDIIGHIPAPRRVFEPADHRKGEIGRVSPDLVYKLKAMRLPIHAGDMLVWADRGNGTGFQIWAQNDGGENNGPISLSDLPHKTQKRAKLCMPTVLS